MMLQNVKMTNSKIRIFLLAVSGILFFSGCAMHSSVSDSPHINPIASVKRDIDYYPTVMKNLSRENFTAAAIDFRRFQYSRLLSGIWEPDENSLKNLDAAIEQKRWEDVVRLGEELLLESFADIRLHQIVAIGYYGLNKMDQYDFHTNFWQKLIHSIIDNKSGNAYEVFDVRDEYAVIWYLGYKKKSVDLVEMDGRHYDFMTCENKNGVEVIIEFDIDKYFHQLHREVNKK